MKLYHEGIDAGKIEYVNITTETSWHLCEFPDQWLDGNEHQTAVNCYKNPSMKKVEQSLEISEFGSEKTNLKTFRHQRRTKKKSQNSNFDFIL